MERKDHGIQANNKIEVYRRYLQIDFGNLIPFTQKTLDGLTFHHLSSSLMTTAEREKKFSLIAETLEGRGPVKLQQRMRKILMECPELTLDERLEHLDITENVQSGSELVTKLEAQKIKITTLFDSDYPPTLRMISDPPLVLFFSGNLDILNAPCISVIGARSCTTYGIQATRNITSELARLGLTIVSGLALGIDAVAHQSAIESGGRTACILGSGLRNVYPSQHKNLARNAIRSDGLVLTEFPPHESPKPYHFPMRNRIISGLSQATIVIEAEQKSGTLITAQFCLDQGRELFALPGPVHHATSQGTHQLISRGEAQIFTSTQNVLDCLGLQELLESIPKNTPRKINDPLLCAIYDSLDAFQPSDFDQVLVDLAPEFPLSAGELSSKMAQLEADGFITTLPGPKYLKIPGDCYV